MVTRFSLALAGLCALLAAACARPDGIATGAAGTGRPMTGAAPVDAALVTSDFGWVLTPDRLLVSHDDGASFADSGLPLPAGTVRAAHFVDADNGIVASASGLALTVARTSDGGRTWQTSTVRDPNAGPTGYSSLRVSFRDRRTGAMLARVATGPAFSLGTLFTTADGGASWSARSAPEAGLVTVDSAGRVWLAGATLDVTADHGQHWTRVTLDLAGPVDATTVAPPVDGDLPVTVIRNGQSEVDILRTDDNGRTWGHPVRLPVHARTGPGVRIPVATTGAGLVAFDTAAGHAYPINGRGDLRPMGLPEGIETVSFGGGGFGWALTAHGSCVRGKEDCALHHELAVTGDAGYGWRTVADWTDPVR
jgi:photosystem II stability/assembly factor-like uncharacterized protein